MLPLLVGADDPVQNVQHLCKPCVCKVQGISCGVRGCTSHRFVQSQSAFVLEQKAEKRTRHYHWVFDGRRSWRVCISLTHRLPSPTLSLLLETFCNLGGQDFHDVRANAVWSTCDSRRRKNASIHTRGRNERTSIVARHCLCRMPASNPAERGI